MIQSKGRMGTFLWDHQQRVGMGRGSLKFSFSSCPPGTASSAIIPNPDPKPPHNSCFPFALLQSKNPNTQQWGALTARYKSLGKIHHPTAWGKMWSWLLSKQRKAAASDPEQQSDPHWRSPKPTAVPEQPSCCPGILLLASDHSRNLQREHILQIIKCLIIPLLPALQPESEDFIFLWF